MRSTRLTIGLMAVLSAAALALPLSAVAPASAASDDAIVATGSDWEVSRAPGGFLVELRLEERLPVRSAAPTLFVNDELLGVATEDAAGTTLRVTTADPRVADAQDVELGWGSRSAAEIAAPRDTATRRSAPPASAIAPATVLADDPAATGDYTVARADYDLGDEAAAVVGSTTVRGEMRGAIYYPAEKTTPSPVVVFLHGRHTSCTSTSTPSDVPWPCPAGSSSIPSYLGYTQMADSLASNGYVVLSISANAINAIDNGFDDLGATARGQLVLDSLDLLSAADAGTSTVLSADLAGRLDLNDVGLMGHSRGGDGVVKAALLNARRTSPYGIRSVLPLAPTDFIRQSLPGAAMAVMLPYCDGDVADLQGQHFIDDSRRYGDDTLRSSVLMMGANHNFFNTYWTPEEYEEATSDDWSDQTDPDCGAQAEARLSPAEQRAAGNVWLSGFFRLTLGGEQQYLPLVDGSRSTTTSAGDADVRVTASLPSSSWTSVDAFTGSSDADVTNGEAKICNSFAGAVATGSACASVLSGDQLPHWTPGALAPTAPASPMMHFTWSATGGELRVPVSADEQPDTGDQLRVKIAPDENVVGSTDVSLTVVDGSGRTQRVDIVSAGDQLQVLPGTAEPLRKVLLRDVVVPVSRLTDIDTTDIAEIRLTGETDSGGVYVSDLGFGVAALGEPAVSALPAVSLVETRIEEGAASSTFGAAVLLSAPSADPVRADVTLVARGFGNDHQGTVSVYLAPGETCAVVRLPTSGDKAPAVLPLSKYSMSITEPQAAQLGTATAPLIVHDDDSRAPGAEDLSFGVQGDPCAEAAQTAATIDVSTPTVKQGGEVRATATGFRVGESVRASLERDGVKAELAGLTNDGGRLTLSGLIGGDVAPGATGIRFVGAGSQRQADGALTITAGSGGGGGGNGGGNGPDGGGSGSNGAGGGVTPAGGAGSSASGSLASTGADSEPWLVGSLLVMLLGGAAWMTARRRAQS